MIRPFLAAVLAAAAAASTLAQTVVSPPAAPATRVRLGTWNLEFFGNRRDHPRSKDDVRKVAAYIAELGIDVLAVQEIGTLEALQELAQLLGPRWQFVLGTTGMWRDGSGGQRVGFLWHDERIELLQAEELLSLPREAEDPQTGKLPLFHRIPVSAVFRTRGAAGNGGLDFRAITVHLKADNRRDIEQHMRDEMSTRKRIAEMAALGAALAQCLQRQGEDQDVVVLGDFNHVLARERTTETPDEAKVRFDLRVPLLEKLPGFARLAPKEPAPTIRWFPESIDHVVVSADLQHEAVAGSVAIHGPFTQGTPTDAVLDAWQKTFSDHYPVTVDLDAALDHDPDATFAPVVASHELRAGGWAAANPAPANRPATATPSAGIDARAAESMRLRIGQHVQVTLVNGRVHEGTLVSSLNADWIQIDLDVGHVIAFPTRNVLSVQAK
jgi:endonuclease/exonuclease/phosphatase family metal-dependent hydrolase